MYIQWKVLLGLGTAFWLLLCLSDYLPVNNVLSEKQYSMEIQNKLPSKEKSTANAEGGFDLIKVLFWNVVAFASTISVCFLLKSMSSRLNIINNQSFLLSHGDKSSVRKGSSSRIPIPVSNKSSSTDIHIEGEKIDTKEVLDGDYNKSCPNLVGAKETVEKSEIDSGNNKKMWSLKIMENHCAKLREEMINLQASSLKEQASVSKKMDTLTKEKKDLIKQFNSIVKENKALKQQFNEMIEDRTLLIRRLECATKEMKTATKNKKVTIAKLDEALANAETLKMNLEQIRRDKVNLEDKLIVLDAKNKRLKEEVELYRQKEIEDDQELAGKGKEEKSFKRYASNQTNLDQDDKDVVTQTENCEYICQSEEDIKKVHQKLLTLEKSLENFRLRHECKETSTEDNELNNVEESDGNELNSLCLLSQRNSGGSVKEGPSTNSICTESDCPLEHRECVNAECFLRRKAEDMYTDISSSEDEVNQFMQYKDYIILKKQLPKLKSSISDDRLSVISEKGTSTGDESGHDWSASNRRIVSHSPAFQKFLQDISEAQTKLKFNKSIGKIFE